MNVACLDYCLTEEERLKFERDGFLWWRTPCRCRGSRS